MTGIRPSLIAASRRRFNPLSLSPALWLDASDASTLFDATSGGSLVAADGAVARWEDKSGNSRHATQSGSTARPLRKTSIINGKDVLRFDGSNDWMESGTNATWNFLHNSTAAHVLVVAKCGTVFDPNAAYTLISTGGEPSANIGYSLVYDDRTSTSSNDALRVRAARGVTGAYACDSITQNSISPNQFSILANRIEAGNATASLRSQSRINGTDIANNNTATNSPSGSNSTLALQIGAFNSGAQFALNGDIAEILIFPTALSTADRQRVESYLSQKYNIALA
jgi:hypothetical protein